MCSTYQLYLDLFMIHVDEMAYMRGSRDDWDRWAKLTGDDGLSWDRMLPLMLKVSFLSERERDPPSIYPGIPDGKIYQRFRKSACRGPFRSFSPRPSWQTVGSGIVHKPFIQRIDTPGDKGTR